MLIRDEEKFLEGQTQIERKELQKLNNKISVLGWIVIYISAIGSGLCLAGCMKFLQIRFSEIPRVMDARDYI